MAFEAKSSILILGGGLMGLTIAHSLASHGKKVEVLSRSRNEAAGFMAAGMLAPHSEGLTNHLLKLGQVSLKKIPFWVKKIEDDSGIHCGLRQCGIIVPFRNSDLRDQYPTSSFGQRLNRSELITELPGLADHWTTGLLFHQDGQIDNRRRLMRALEKACVELGVQFQEGVEVLEIFAQDKVFQGVKVKTEIGEIKTIDCKQGILCSGAWSKKLMHEIPIFPVKGQMLSIQAPKNALPRIIFGPGTYLVPREDGLIIVGATNEKSSEFVEGLTPLGQRELHEGIQNILPKANQWPRMERWWGFRPCTPDEMPIMGNSPLKGLWLATGHHRNGVLLAAITAELITKSICQIELNAEEKNLLNYFHWSRFQRND